MSNRIIKEIKNTWVYAKKEYFNKFIISLLLRGSLLIIPVLYSIGVNYISSGDYNRAIVLFIVSIIITGLYRFFECSNQYFYYKLYNKLSSHYTDLAISKTYDNSMYSLSRFDLGIYTNTLVSDVDIISSFVGSLVYRIVQVLELIIIFVYFYFLNKYIFISALVVTTIMIILSFISGKKIEILNKNRKDTLDKATNSFHEYFLGMKDIKSFNLFSSISSQVFKKSDNYLEANAEYNNKYQYFNHAFLYIFEIFRLITMIYGVTLIKNNILDIGVLLIIYNYYQKIIDNYTTILTMSLEKRNLNVSLDRYYRLLEYSREKDQKENLPDINIEGDIEFKSVLYGDKNHPTLDNVSFFIQKHSLTVITGESGNGKTGIFELLLKLNRQHDGIIKIDNYDINDFSDDNYFEMISSARKQATLFKSSIRSNLSFLNDDDKKIEEICKSIGAHDLIMKLSNGYDTVITDNNINDGLKQLLAIARVLIRNSNIMLFDEAIIGLGDIYQKKVLTLFKELKNTHTIIVISHDKDLFEIADKIIVIDDHKVVETGNLQKLSKIKGKFYELYEMNTVNHKKKVAK